MFIEFFIYAEKEEEYICSLTPVKGICGFLHLDLARWYYSLATNSCKMFTYGGCFGNGNNFETQEECEKRCKIGAWSILSEIHEINGFDLHLKTWLFFLSKCALLNISIK